MRHNLSEVNRLIQDRRTIYPEQFSDRKVHREQIEMLLESARWAPTHKLTQPWNFKVFMEAGIEKFANWHAESYKQITPADKFSEMKYNTLKTRPLKASAVIVVSMKRDENQSVPEIEELAAVGCAVQNMHLTATAAGLGFYWGTGGLTFHPMMKEFLGLKEEDRVMGLLFVGYPAIEWPRKTQRKPIEYYTEFIEQ